VPLVVHVPDPVLEFPFSGVFGLLMQEITSGPAFTNGESNIVSTIVSWTALQIPFPVVVRMRKIFPAAVSAALAV
jgi:hypothetical protein